MEYDRFAVDRMVTFLMSALLADGVWSYCGKRYLMYERHRGLPAKQVTARGSLGSNEHSRRLQAKLSLVFRGIASSFRDVIFSSLYASEMHLTDVSVLKNLAEGGG